MTVSSYAMNPTFATSRGMLSPARLDTYGSNSVVSGSFSQSIPEFNDTDETELLSVSWNQDYSCIAAGTSHGFRIYNCDPFRETCRRDFKHGGFRIVEMLFRSNVLALVGAGTNSQSSRNKVMIWDDSQKACVGEFSFRSEIRAVKLRRDRIIVVLEYKIYVYDFTDLRLLQQIETIANPRGLCCLSHPTITTNVLASPHMLACPVVLACPGLQRGQVRIEHFGLDMTKLITAHDSHVACLTLTMDGLLLATASTKGTLIRIFNTMDGNLLQEVRRGVDKAEIYSIALSPNVQWLAVSSDKGTVHIFSLKVRVVGEDSSAHSITARGPAPVYHHSSSSNCLDALVSSSSNCLDTLVSSSSNCLDKLVSPNAGANPGSSLSFMKGFLPKYFSSEWSFAQFRLLDDTEFVAAFGSHSTVVIAGLNGCFYRCSFDPLNGGEMLQEEYYNFLKNDSRPR